MSVKAYCWAFLFSGLLWVLWVAILVGLSVLAMDPIGVLTWFGR